MARIVLGSYMFRYPLGGMLSWALQYLLGLKDLGHEVFFVEKYGYANACFDPVKGMMSNDCSHGLQVVGELLARFGLENKWCFVEYGDRYHGISKKGIEDVFRSADVFFDMGTHGSWADEAAAASLRVLIDGEPGFTQIKMANKQVAGIPLVAYDRYYTNGKNLGLNGNPTPLAGIQWGRLFHPVKVDIFPLQPPPPAAAYSTIMNWRSHDPIEYAGKVYGQKDVEFSKFLDLPRRVAAPMELAVSGKDVPVETLQDNGWTVRDGRLVTLSFDAFRDYLSASRGEFSICKNVFIANRTGWFSDKSAAYLASGRPVVLQDTGFSDHLPCGDGLFAVNTADEAAAAIQEIECNYERHSSAARAIACEYLDAKKVMKQLLDELGINT
ncbi:MAG: hypothetical protein L6Q97_01530 [Thermoanaerobaculia bacterium]|nr:hypothetical protein [Thermoanaerobaculia bacterium]